MLHCRVSQGPLTRKPAATSLYVQAKFPHQIMSAAQAFAWWPSCKTTTSLFLGWMLNNVE